MIYNCYLINSNVNLRAKVFLLNEISKFIQTIFLKYLNVFVYPFPQELFIPIFRNLTGLKHTFAKNIHFMLKKSDIIYGFNPVIEAIGAGKDIEKIFVLRSLRPEKLQDIKNAALERNIPFQYVPKEKLNKLTNQNHQGIVALTSPVEYIDIESLLPGLFESGKTPLLLILDKITDVRNLGSIARTAECAGVNAMIVPSKGSALINADAVKTSVGALTRINLCRTNSLLDTLQFLKESGIKLFAASEKAAKSYFDVDYNLPSAIVMGSEEKGIADEFLEFSDEQIRIPMTGTIQSLNVSVAAGIILFEAVKQRTINP